MVRVPNFSDTSTTSTSTPASAAQISSRRRGVSGRIAKPPGKGGTRNGEGKSNLETRNSLRPQSLPDRHQRISNFEFRVSISTFLRLAFHFPAQTLRDEAGAPAAR